MPLQGLSGCGWLFPRDAAELVFYLRVAEQLVEVIHTWVCSAQYYEPNLKFRYGCSREQNPATV